MARVLILTPDLLFGSNLLGALAAAGHQGALCADREALEREAAGTDLVIVDLTDEAGERSKTVADLIASGRLDGVRTLGFHSHVDPGSRDAGLQAGIERVVPRSRMNREAATLVAALLDGDGSR